MNMSTTMASLILEDGSTFKGRLFGANISVSGEVGKSFLSELTLVFHVSAFQLKLSDYFLDCIQ